MTWPLVRLGDVAPAKPSKHAFSTSDEVWTLNLDQIEADTGSLLGKVMVPASEAGTSTHGFDERHVLYSKLRPYLNKVVLPDDKGLATTELVPMLPDPLRLDRKYLAYYLRSKSFVDWVSSQVAGAKMPRVSMQLFWQHEIPLPPLPEQKRIAAILDKADAIRRKRQQAIQLADDFLRAVFLDMFGDPVTNPKGWGLRKFSEVCRQITVGVVVKPASYYVENGVPAIRSLNIKNYGISRENLVFFSVEDNEKVLSKSRVYEGDLVIVRSGQPGKAAVITKDLDGVNAIDVLIARPAFDHLNSDYLAYFFNSGAAKSIVLAEGRGQVQQHLNVGSLNAAEIPIPPLELQNGFAEVLKKVETKYLRFDETPFGELFNSISQRAFSGQL